MCEGKADLKIEFIGDSISAGCGVLGDFRQNKSVENSNSTKKYCLFGAGIEFKNHIQSVGDQIRHIGGKRAPAARAQIEWGKELADFIEK